MINQKEILVPEGFELHSYKEVPSEYKKYNFDILKDIRIKAMKNNQDPARVMKAHSLASPDNWLLSDEKKWLHMFFNIPFQAYYNDKFIEVVTT